MPITRFISHIFSPLMYILETIYNFTVTNDYTSCCSTLQAKNTKNNQAHQKASRKQIQANLPHTYQISDGK